MKTKTDEYTDGLAEVGEAFLSAMRLAESVGQSLSLDDQLKLAEYFIKLELVHGSPERKEVMIKGLTMSLVLTIQQYLKEKKEGDQNVVQE